MTSIQPAGLQVEGVALQNVNCTEIHGVMVPMEYVDPISLSIMLEPMIVQPSGNSYDKLTLEAHKRTFGLLKDPIHKTDIQGFSVPNRALKDAINRFLTQHPNLKEKVTLEWKEEEQKLEASAQKIITLTAREFSNLFVDKDRHTFPEDKEIRVYGIEQDLALKFYVAGEAHDDERVSYISMRILSEVMLLTGNSVKKLSYFNGLQLNASLSNERNKSYISLNSSGAITVIVEKAAIHTTMKKLFEKMCQDDVSYLNIGPGQPIIFHKVSKSTLSWLVSDRTRCKEKLGILFTTAIPPGYKNFTFEANSYGLDVDIENKSLLLVSNDGIRLTLEK